MMTEQNTTQEQSQDELAKTPEAEQINDFPLGEACDLSGEGACEACQ